MEVFPSLKVKVWGDYALFTQPEAKVERVSYPCMTPSAARGILEAIFWKPEFDWHIRKIAVLKPVAFESIVRNEVGGMIAEGTVKGKTYSEYCTDDDRQQRHSLFLRNVAYIIEADVVLRDHADTDVAKYRDIFRRRVKKGQCFNQPYLGTRECMAHFSEVDEQNDRPEPVNIEIGSMLFDLKYPEPDSKAKTAIPYFFQAKLNNGTLDIPGHLYEVVR
ncbi:MAG TPA: type I-C CRISPR-associated protein Cas5c [Bacillales bacterium]|nr:type I-C CRISPR-associated protein Cas5c [Bacillales bacterium]